MITTLLQIQHAQAIRNNDREGALDLEKELSKHGVHARWLSDTVMVWETEKKSTPTKKTPTTKSVDKEFYADIICKVCGGPVEKTGRQGRPPTKCLKHR